MSQKHLHIISFDIPFPADYGGVIDVFYKIKSLSEYGISVHLHCFEYGRAEAKILNKYCTSVNYYTRNIGFTKNLSTTPYIIKTRESKLLLSRLSADNYPILCEGMHSCGLLTKGDWKNRMVIYRSSNVEHDYYQALASKELNSIKKLFFNIEAWKLKRWEKNLAKTDLMLTVSEMDEAYYKNRFPKNKIENIYSFFDQEESNRNYDQVIDDRIILYHGNLSVQENIHTANYIIDELSRDVHFPFVIAGKNPSEALLQKATKVRNVEIIANPDDVAMKKLLSTAQIHLLLTDQTTGLKLKLLYSIFEGKHCLVNDKMLAGTNLEACTHIANSKEEIVVAIYKLMGIPFDNHAFEERKTQIPIDYINEEKVKKLVKLVWG